MPTLSFPRPRHGLECVLLLGMKHSAWWSRYRLAGQILERENIHVGRPTGQTHVPKGVKVEGLDRGVIGVLWPAFSVFPQGSRIEVSMFPLGCTFEFASAQPATSSVPLNAWVRVEPDNTVTLLVSQTKIADAPVPLDSSANTSAWTSSR